jgi:two-component system, cell cycle sensor histidine kinase and response regulator CckA
MSDERAIEIATVVRGVAHDLNNLLVAITLSTRLARSALPSGSVVREDLDAIDEAAGRAAALVRELLSLGSTRTSASRRSTGAP